MFILSFLFCLAVISSLWKKNDGWKNTLLNLLFYCSTWTALSYYSNSFSCDSCPWSWRSTQYAYLLNWDVLEISLEFFNLYIIAKIRHIWNIREFNPYICIFLFSCCFFHGIIKCWCGSLAHFSCIIFLQQCYSLTRPLKFKAILIDFFLLSGGCHKKLCFIGDRCMTIYCQIILRYSIKHIAMFDFTQCNYTLI